MNMDLANQSMLPGAELPHQMIKQAHWIKVLSLSALNNSQAAQTKDPFFFGNQTAKEEQEQNHWMPWFVCLVSTS